MKQIKLCAGYAIILKDLIEYNSYYVASADSTHIRNEIKRVEDQKNQLIMEVTSMFKFIIR